MARGPRPWGRWALGGASVLALVAIASRAGRRPTALDAPPSLMDPGGRFPRFFEDLPVAAPLAPLLARDVPDALALLEPAAGSARVMQGESLRIRFNRPMVSVGRVHQPPEGEPPVTFDPPVPGTLRWLSRSALSFTPDRATTVRTIEARLQVSPSLRSLAGESLEPVEDRVVVFTGGSVALTERTPRRVLPGEPLPLFFSNPPDLSTVSSQLVAYESGGAQRALRFGLSARGRSDDGIYRVDVRLDRALEPGARVAMLLSPTLVAPYDDGEGEFGASSPREIVVELRPRPRVEGFGCSVGADQADGCAQQGAVDGVLDIEDTLRLLASSALASDPAPAVRVSPALAGQRVGVQGRTLSITGEWEPDQVYEVRVEGLREEGGTPLARVQPLAVRSRGLAPRVTVRPGLQTFERSGPAVLGFSAVNVGRGALRYAPLEAGRDLAFVLGQQSAVLASGAALPLAPLAPTARVNRAGPGAFAFVSPREGRVSPVAAVTFRPGGDADDSGSIAIVQHTDLGLSARVLPRGVLAWVTSIATGRPVEGADVTLGWASGGAVRTAPVVRTDSDGLAWIPAPDGLSPVDVELALSAGLREDRAVLSLDPRTSLTSASLGLSQGAVAPGADGASIAAVFTDRGAYRPGDSVRVKVIARRPVTCGPRARAGCNPEEVRALARQRVRVALVDPTDASPVAARVVRTNGFGTADALFELPSRANAGSWRVVVTGERESSRTMGEAGLTVAEFRPPTARVDLQDIPPIALDRDALSASVTARYLFGAPIPRGRARWTLERALDRELPLPWSRTHTFSSVDADARSTSAGSGELELGADGRGTIQQLLSVSASARQRFTLEVDVRDASGQSTASRRAFTVRPARYEVGVRQTPPFLGAGAPLDVDAVVIDAQGAAVAGQPVRARIVREGWSSYYEWVRRDGEDGAFRARRSREEREVARCALLSGVEPVHCRWQPDRPGGYRLEAEVTDPEGRRAIASHRVYVAGPGEQPDRDAPGAPVTVSPSQRSYAVGETARIAFESPWPDAEALLVVAREGALHTERRRVRGGGNVFEFSVDPSMVPNAFVHVSIVRPRTGEPDVGVDLHAPDLRVGVAEIGVRPRVSALHVDVGLPRGSARPGDEVPIEVRVRGADGAPARAEVALYLVDEGTLRLTSYEVPRPTEQFFPRRAPRFMVDDVRRALVSRLDVGALPGASGDGTDDASARRAMRDERERFEPTPLWLPHLTVGSDGIARARVRLPARPTEYRVIAVANDHGTRAGSATASLTATLPAVLRPQLPTGVIEGDRFDAVTFVSNPGTSPVVVTVRGLLAGREALRQDLHLAPGAEGRASFPVHVSMGSERIDVRFEATASGVTDARDTTVVVRPRALPQRAWMVGAVQGSRELRVEVPPGSIARGARFELTLAAHPFVGFEAAADSLEDGGAQLEALASRALGLVAYASMTTDPARAQDARRRGQTAIAELSALQTTAGHFAQWDRDMEPWLYGTIYALDAIEAARAAGWTMPEGLRERALDAVQSLVRSQSLVDYESAYRNDLLAYGLRLLSQAGRPNVGRVLSLLELKETLSGFGLAQLALAMPSTDPRRATVIREASARALAAIDRARRTSGVRADGERSSPRWYEGGTRDLAALQRAAAEVLPSLDQARALTTHLLERRRDGAWEGPYETAHALVALAAYARRFSAGGLSRTTVWLDGAELPGRDAGGRARVYALPTSAREGQHRLTLRAEGPAFFALDGRWNRALTDTDGVARGRVVALHRVLERASGERLDAGAHVRTGELVRVRLFVFSEQEPPANVAVIDPIGGGFDAVDRGLDTTPQASLEAILGGSSADETVDPRGYHASRTLPYLSRRTFEQGEARFHASRAGAGLLEFTYAIRATTPGTFTLLPARITARTDAGFVGRSAASSLVIDP